MPFKVMPCPEAKGHWVEPKIPQSVKALLVKNPKALDGLSKERLAAAEIALKGVAVVQPIIVTVKEGDRVTEIGFEYSAPCKERPVTLLVHALQPGGLQSVLEADLIEYVKTIRLEA
jgi:hypothetical protein